MIEHGKTSIPTVGDFLNAMDTDPRVKESQLLCSPKTKTSVALGWSLLSGKRFFLALSPKLVQQRLRLLQIFRLKPFGEPVVDLRQHLLGFLLFPLSQPQPAQTHHGT